MTTKINKGTEGWSYFCMFICCYLSSWSQPLLREKNKESKFVDCRCLDLGKNVNFCAALVCPGNYQDHLLLAVNKRPMVASAPMFWGTRHISLFLWWNGNLKWVIWDREPLCDKHQEKWWDFQILKSDGVKSTSQMHFSDTKPVTFFLLFLSRSNFRVCPASLDALTQLH